MSLHQTDNVKEPKTRTPELPPFYRGDRASWFFATAAGTVWTIAAVERHIWGAVGTVNNHFADLCQKRLNPAEMLKFPGL